MQGFLLLLVLFGICDIASSWIEGLAQGNSLWWLLTGGVIAAILFRLIIGEFGKRSSKNEGLFNTLGYWGPVVILVVMLIEIIAHSPP
jgi:lipopolysaccharide export LptBFGC system permease protein LptF